MAAINFYITHVCIFPQENCRLGGCFQWPTVPEVMAYRNQVCQTILDVINNADLELPVTPDHPWVRLLVEHTSH